MLFDILKAKSNIITNDLFSDLWKKNRSEDSDSGDDSGDDTDVDIVSWADGTAAQIKAMLDAEKAGKINTADSWSVGDKRTFHLSAIPAFTKNGVEIIGAQAAQDVEIALAHKGLYTAANNQTVCWVVAFVDCLAQQGMMNGTNTNSGSWNGAAIREYLNDYVFQAMSAEDRAIFTQFKTVTANPYNGTVLETSLDYLALLAEKEIFGAETYSNLTEANALTQIDYYKTAESHTKTAGGNLCYWWQRSPTKDYDSAFCLSNIGNASFNPAGSKQGISPFGCV